jgi:hypothetical protein
MGGSLSLMSGWYQGSPASGSREPGKVSRPDRDGWGAVRTVPLQGWPQECSRCHKGQPMDDTGRCRGTYEGAGGCRRRWSSLVMARTRAAGRAWPRRSPCASLSSPTAGVRWPDQGGPETGPAPAAAGAGSFSFRSEAVCCDRPKRASARACMSGAASRSSTPRFFFRRSREPQRWKAGPACCLPHPLPVPPPLGHSTSPLP